MTQLRGLGGKRDHCIGDRRLRQRGRKGISTAWDIHADDAASPSPLNFQDAVLAAVFWQVQAELYVALALQLLEPSVSVQRASAQLPVQQSSAGL